MAYRTHHGSDLIGPPSSLARRDAGGLLQIAVLRSRATLRAGVRQSGLSATALEQGFPTVGVWEGGWQRRIFAAVARGELIVEPEGRALFYDPIAQEQRPLWREIFRQYDEARRAFYCLFFRAVDPSPIEVQALGAAFSQMPLPVQLLRRVPRQNRAGKWTAFERVCSAALVRQLVRMGGPLEVGLAVFVARFFKDAGQHQDLLDCHGDVMAAIAGPKLRDFFGADLEEARQRTREILTLRGTGYEDLLDEPAPKQEAVPSEAATLEPATMALDSLPRFVVMGHRGLGCFL